MVWQLLKCSYPIVLPIMMERAWRKECEELFCTLNARKDA